MRIFQHGLCQSSEILKKTNLPDNFKEKILQANMMSEGKVEERRFLKTLQKERKERETDEAIRKVYP